MLSGASVSAAVAHVSSAVKSKLKRRPKFRFSISSDPRNPQFVACEDSMLDLRVHFKV